MNINEVNEKIIDLEKKREIFVNYLNNGSDIEVLEIEEAIKSYDIKIKELKIFIEKMNN